MLHEKWEPLWEHEIENLFTIQTVVKAMKKRSGQEYDIIVDLMILVKEIINHDYCPKVTEFIKKHFRENAQYLPKFFKDKKHQGRAVQLMAVHKSDSALHIAAR